MTQKMMNWDEKYKPAKISEIVGQRTISKRLQAYASAKRMPHLLFAGPAGVGKTSSFYALAKEIFGSGYINSLPPELIAKLKQYEYELHEGKYYYVSHRRFQELIKECIEESKHA